MNCVYISVHFTLSVKFGQHLSLQSLATFTNLGAVIGHDHMVVGFTPTYAISACHH